ncbi:MAG: YdiU family protein [Rhodospirillaceae bacterium]|nr:YdiU family protein [Rhodospirillaceae bacterium]
MNVTTNNSAHFPFDNSYARLPERFYARLSPTPVSDPVLIKINHPLARHLGLDPDFLDSPKGAEIFSGSHVAEGSDPLAMAYAGHQFGGWVSQLGDGRAHLLGEVIDGDGMRRDIQLKGSGPTPYSRSGDGRAGIGPVLREYVVSEAMAALNIPTTRALAAVTTGEKVFRDDVVPGAVLTRVASSHIRIGTFQFFAARQDMDALKILADHVIDRHYPEAREAENPYLSLLQHVIDRQAALIAKWMAVGFIHGVMNTDNMLISGETIDYGPCAFMDSYHPDMVFSSIDHMGRYAYQNQPTIAQWNLASFASCLLGLIHGDQDSAIRAAEAAVNTFGDRFDAAWSAAFRAKIGLGEERDGDVALAQDLLGRMAENKADFTLTFRRLSGLSGQDAGADASVGALFENPASFNEWAVKWRARLALESSSDGARQSAMGAINPAYIPRNHRVEQVIMAALEGDLGPFERLLDILSAPFDEQPSNAAYQQPPRPDEIVHETFCGT